MLLVLLKIEIFSLQFGNITQPVIALTEVALPHDLLVNAVRLAMVVNVARIAAGVATCVTRAISSSDSPGPETDFHDDSEFRIFVEIR